MAVVSLNTNIAASRTQRLLGRSTRQLGLSFERLSSGLRINRASDDAAGLAIASSLNVDRKVFAQGIRNANDAISLLNIADGAVQQLGSIVTRLQELATGSANGTLSLEQRRSLDKEGVALVEEFNRITNTVRFNDRNLIDGLFDELKVQLGYGDSGSISFGLGQDLARNIGDGNHNISELIASSSAGQTALSADFDGDGIVDIVTGAGDGSGFGLHRGNGDGTFGAYEALGVGLVNVEAYTVDIDNDGDMDIITPDAFTNTIDVLYNDGTAKFSSKQHSTPNGADFITIGDINNDGRIDVVAGRNFSRTYDVMLQDADGNFNHASTVNGGSSNASSSRLGDMNGDGFVDLVAITGDNARTVSVYYGDGSGNFSFSNSYEFAGNVNDDIRLADLNYDGVLDIIAESGTSNIEIFSLDQAGNVVDTESLTYGFGLTDIEIADADGDGYLDIYATNLNTDDIALFTNLDGEGFDSGQTFATGRGPSDLTINDFNGDGVLDVASSNSSDASLGVLLQDAVASGTMQRINLLTQDNARTSLDILDEVSSRVLTEIGAIGSTMSRLETAVKSLSQSVESYASAQSRIEDVDVASEASRLARSQILQQAGAAVLSQANQLPALALSLLRT